MYNIIYQLVNTRKQKLNQLPYLYVGSKLNYKPGTYWGSSKHPVLLEELEKSITDFNIEILEYVSEPSDLLTRERYWHDKLDVVANQTFYNLVKAKEKFTTIGMRFYYDPVTLKFGLFPNNKVPTGWQLGKKPKLKDRISTGFKRGDLLLNNHLSEKLKLVAKRGKDHKDTKEWTLQDPYGNIHIVAGLYPFCRKHNLSPSALQYSEITNRPIKKGKSKGWCVLSKSEL